MAAIVLIIGSLTLFEYVSGLSIGIDQLLFRDDMTQFGELLKQVRIPTELAGKLATVLRGEVRPDLQGKLPVGD